MQKVIDQWVIYSAGSAPTDILFQRTSAPLERKRCDLMEIQD
jgi:hypothetical protein